MHVHTICPYRAPIIYLCLTLTLALTLMQESDFQLEANLVPMDIKLPKKEGDVILKGMAMLQREVAKGAQQRRTLSAGGSLRVEFANELRGRGCRARRYMPPPS